ncbi:hypothetical protein SERLA73DRAFT_118586 [Serpula lacrymans var. lacrymans S7.3]|uniref:Uncharacterized protein n=1 Tax=Serpula lacrymans var. lacrymans (strain S7.3) TaxID=936435 RepID=F8PI40_SERL3|nr:hypothetical protein SERLA73DRAFT_118586 [Serpula lacrymans var. lacrymans S7.3]
METEHSLTFLLSEKTREAICRSSCFHDAPSVGLNFMGESLQIDDIKTEYHPTRGRTAKVDHFSDFKCGFSGKARIKNSCLWQLFKSRVDFEFAEVALEAASNKDQINRLVKVIHQKHFVFDAKRLFKCNGDNFVQFIDKPWTAGDFWDIQMAESLYILFYMLIKQLSSFGTVKGYPIITRCAKLPTDIQNGTGIGGGRVVGWLPVVPEDEEHKGKKSFANFKNVVWHELFLKVVESLELHAKTGYYYQRTEGDVLYLFPIILILSADYEEQCAMPSSHGTNCNFPCPICLVPRDKLSDTTQTFTRRTSAHSESILLEAKQQQTAANKEIVLKNCGLCPVKEFLFWIEAEGQAASHQLDDQYNLNHFGRVASIEILDATKHEGISKMVIFALHNVFDVQLHKPAHLLLKSIHLFLDVDMYTGLTVHTTETIAAGRQALKLFSQDMDLHGPLKDSYRFRTNFKHVAEQILQADHWCLVSCFIRQDIAAFDSQLMGDLKGDEVDLKITKMSHVLLGLKCPATSFQGLEESRKDNAAFTSFLQINIAFPGGKHIKLGAEDKITECCFMKVDYESIVVDSRIFARLIMLFICTIDQVDYLFALVQPYDAPVGRRQHKDKDLGLWRIWAKSCSDAEFVPLRSIVCGAAMAPDYKVSGNFFLIDTVDSDWFLRTKKMWSKLPAKHT